MAKGKELENSEKEESLSLGKEIVKEEKKIFNDLKKNPWIVSTFVFAVVALILLFVAFSGGVGGGIGENAIGEKAVNFINNDLLQGQATVTLDSVSEKAGLYEVVVDFQGSPVPTYFTKDGEFYLGNQLMETSVSDTSSDSPITGEVVKSDKPVVELFIMTHCPYGTQAEKGVLPALKALGNEVDSKIRFVHYFMHGEKEETETYRQLCIREQQPAKFENYLNCFLEDGDSSRCMAKVGVPSVDSCMAGKAKDYYAEDSELSEGYGVQGSPTLVINGAEVDFYPRSPANALAVICSAFNTQPAVCETQLDDANPAPGFGTSTTTANTDATC